MTTASATTVLATSFEVGKTYQTRSLCDYECVFSFTVVARTAKFITVNHGGKVSRVGVYVWDGVESAKPLGSYSMCPIIRANKEVA